MKYTKPTIKLISPVRVNCKDGKPGGDSGCGMCKIFSSDSKVNRK